ncbi:MAG: SUMF1/EgtB/PvdO family nonheme iron enzyme [Planctomycetes bacterium]|nr:SUMF1/EgtB/PvdO family nonheme iron enzyme [Planctomycetota bacterium]
MAKVSSIQKWVGQLNSRVPFVGKDIARSACQKLAADKGPLTVPFLVSALANKDQQIRTIAENALESLTDPDALDALALGYTFTQQESLHRILESLGRNVPVRPELSSVGQPSAVATVSGTAEQVWQFHNKRDETLLAFVPEGDFLAGREKFRVHLPAYYLALTCVTNTQYVKFLDRRCPDPAQLKKWINLKQCDAIYKENNTYKVHPDKAEFPVIWTTWEGAAAYSKWAGLKLPTELEWEKGARGVDGRLYPWGDEWEAGRPRAEEGTERKPEEITSVLSYPTGRSPYGLYQMIGNVYEWCLDWYQESAYQRYSQSDLKSPQKGEHKVLRGGPWCFGTPAHLRTEYRKSTVWRAGTPLCGFRCAKSL